jgi:hypothetical protein
MPEYSKLGIATAAVTGVVAADQLAKGLRAERHKSDHAIDHFTKAGVNAAVAIAALGLLTHDTTATDIVKKISKTTRNITPDDNYSGHSRRLVEEIIGAYSLVQEMIGNTKHHTAHMILEALGGVAALRDMHHHAHH